MGNSTTHTFRVGDRVRRIAGDCAGMYQGDIGTVAYLHGGNGIAIAEYMGHSGSANHAAYNFELVTPTEESYDIY